MQIPLSYPASTVRAGTAALQHPQYREPGTSLALGPCHPDWVSISPDGTLTLTPPAQTAPGMHRVPITIHAPGCSRSAVADVAVLPAAIPEAEQHSIDPWCEVETAPGHLGGLAIVTVDGGHPLPRGARVEEALRGTRLAAAPVAESALWVASPRLVPTLRLRVLYADGSSDTADATLRLHENA